VNLLLVGCSYKTTPIELREKLAFDGPKLPAVLRELETRYATEAAVLSTCNRVELYLARADAGGPDGELIIGSRDRRFGHAFTCRRGSTRFATCFASPAASIV
jgi:hypothetical protein